MRTAYTAGHQHLIESKGPDSFWVHRFEDGLQDLGQRFSRVVFFSRTQQDAERYVKQMQNAPELR